jgi:hypothetical protein
MWAYGCSLAGILGSNPAGGLGSLSLVSVVRFPVQVSGTGRSLVQRSPAECGVSECDIEMSKTRRTWPTKGLLRQKKYNFAKGNR